MCEPLTIAAIGASTIGTGLSAYAGFERASAAREAGQRNATLADVAAGDALLRGGALAGRAVSRGNAVIAGQRLAEVGTGALVGTGSGADVEQSTALLSKADEEIIRNNATREALGYRSKGELFRQQAEVDARASELGAYASVLSGVGQVTGLLGRQYTDRPASLNVREPVGRGDSTPENGFYGGSTYYPVGDPWFRG